MGRQVTQPGDRLQPSGTVAPRLPEAQEAIIADRVELASRIMRQVGAGASPARDILMPPLKEAISFLAERGNPITQVKMLRACQNIPNFDFVEALKKPLNSPVNWVRSQALAIIASDQASARAVGSDLATEMGFDLANGLLPMRLPAYIKAVLSAGGGRYWWCLILAACCWLLNVLCLLGVAALMYVGAIAYSGTEQMTRWLNEVDALALPLWLGRPSAIAMYTAVVIGAGFIALRSAPDMLWVAIFSSAAGSFALLVVILTAWKGLLSTLFMMVIHGGDAGHGVLSPSGGRLGPGCIFSPWFCTWPVPHESGIGGIAPGLSSIAPGGIAGSRIVSASRSPAY